METFYKEFFEYSHTVNQKIIASFIGHPDKVSEKAIKWISHILNAHQLWNNRIDKQEEGYGVWQVHSLGRLKEIDLTNQRRTLDILKNFPLSKEIDYVNTEGNAFRNSIQDILLHVVNHSTYHRGQIAADFKESGIDPVVTDYIVYRR